MTWIQDWEQFRKNLKAEREAWDRYEAKVQVLKEEVMQEIEHERIRIEQKKRELEEKKKELEKEFEEFQRKKWKAYLRKTKWLHRQYVKEVEKKFKPSMVF